MAQTSPGFSMLSAQSSERRSRLRPATERVLCLTASEASCITSPRSFTTDIPVSKSKTPATVSATYSPKESPATAWQRSTFSRRSTLSRSTPAKPPMYMAGWQYFVISNLDSGPLRQSSSRSKPKIIVALASMPFTAGMSLTAESIFTYCEPWPGKIKATGSGGCSGSEGCGTSSIAFSGCSCVDCSCFGSSFSASASFLDTASNLGPTSAPSLSAVLRARASGPIESSSLEIFDPSGLHQHSFSVS
mmetsp:Transcript_125542/g.280138  ORF Transcript_125542/g.280138 Transcript_125542/m.280138 type:complete len:247 (-) Transcript_125542:346-1086(-)